MSTTTISRDILKDLIEHTLGFDGVDTIKVTGTDKETSINTVSEDRKVIISGKFKTPVDEFTGVFGIPQIIKLKTILSFSDEYNEDAVISMTMKNMNGVDYPVAIRFQNKDSDFVNEHRLMSKSIVDEKIIEVVFAGATWDINFEPSIAGVTRLKKQFMVHNEETAFSTKVENGALVISFGNVATHNANFIFQPTIVGKSKQTLEWPVKHFLKVMDLQGDKRIYISDQGAMKIIVDTAVTVC